MTMSDEPILVTGDRTLEQENAELRRRLSQADAALAQFRDEAIQRRAEIRALAESLPAALSRHAVLREMLSDAWHHPDKPGVARRAIAKAWRAPGKALRLIRERT